jgi:ABC-type antimicrobial peptide transport system permease subunit
VRERPGPVLYTPFMHANAGRGQMIFYVRVDGDVRAVAGRVREEVWRADSTVPQYDVRTLAQEVDAVVFRERLLATVSTFFGAPALILTAIGLHGLLAFLVVQRKRELAIRMALGAERRRAIGLVARETLILVGGGAAIAVVPSAWMLRRISSSWLEDVLFAPSPIDGLTMVSAILALAAVGVLAASIPARRAATVDPTVALRAE